MNTRTIVVTILLLMVPAMGADNPAADRIFKAGAAASNITPPLDRPVVGTWNSPPATNIHDELHARCLVLDDGTYQKGAGSIPAPFSASMPISLFYRWYGCRCGLPMRRCA